MENIIKINPFDPNAVFAVGDFTVKYHGMGDNSLPDGHNTVASFAIRKSVPKKVRVRVCWMWGTVCNTPYFVEMGAEEDFAAVNYTFNVPPICWTRDKTFRFEISQIEYIENPDYKWQARLYEEDPFSYPEPEEMAYAPVASQIIEVPMVKAE